FKRPFNDITVGKEYEIIAYEGSRAIIDDDDDERTVPLENREDYEIRGVDYTVSPVDFKKGDIVWHDSNWFGREGFGEVVGFGRGTGIPEIKGVSAKGISMTFYIRPSQLKLVVSAEN